MKPAVLSLETDHPLELPPFCVSCGNETHQTTRIDIGAGDTSTEALDALKQATGLLTVRTIKVPCCRSCARALNRRTLLAASLFFVGIGLIGLTAAINHLVGRLPELVWQVVAFAAIMTSMVGPIFVYARARDKMIPMDVLRLSKGRLRYIFYSDLFLSAYEKSHPEKDPGAQ